MEVGKRAIQGGNELFSNYLNILHVRNVHTFFVCMLIHTRVCKHAYACKHVCTHAHVHVHAGP